MFCKNCGNPIDSNAIVCPRCGCAKGTGMSYCDYCGQPVALNSASCPNCGQNLTVVTNPNVNMIPASKSKIAAGLFGIFLGGLGIHNFYLGYTGKAVAQLLISILSCGTLAIVSSIWGLIEGILILTGSIPTDANGNLLHD